MTLTEYDEAVVMKQLRDEALEEGMEIGMEKGKKEAVRELVLSLLDVLDEETIAEKAGLAVDEVRRLAKEKT